MWKKIFICFSRFYNSILFSLLQQQQLLLRQQLMMQGYPGFQQSYQGFQQGYPGYQQFGYGYNSPFASPYGQYGNFQQQPFRASGVKNIEPPKKE